MLSSVPVQFLAMLWNPNEPEAKSPKSDGIQGRNQRDEIFKYPKVFDEHDGDDDDDYDDDYETTVYRKRRQARTFLSIKN